MDVPRSPSTWSKKSWRKRPEDTAYTPRDGLSGGSRTHDATLGRAAGKPQSARNEPRSEIHGLGGRWAGWVLVKEQDFARNEASHQQARG